MTLTPPVWPVPAGSATSGGLVAATSGVLGSYDLLCAGGIAVSFNAAAASIVWPTASLAILLPFSLPQAQTANRMLWYNGGTVSGNVDAGIYNEDGTRVVAVGSTVQAGTNVVQVANLTATPLAAGSYFMALVLDNVTGGFFRVGVPGAYLRGAGVQQAAGAFALPASVALANPANSYLPMMAVGFVTAT